jgi:DNA invertase Pin-like site-specific DNA recombinase
MSPQLLQTIITAQSEAAELNKPTCFLFNRVSTKMEEQETSLDQQEEQSFAYAKRKGLHVAYNFRVQETGSKEDERHVFNQMITLLKSDLIDVEHVIFKSADRSSRNRFDKDQLDKLRKKHGVTIHYYGSGRVLHGQSHYTEELQDDIENLFATHFARELSHKIRAANEYKAFEKKQAPTKTAPFGYFWDRNTREHKIDREAEGRVRALFDAFDESKFSLTQFAKHCNENDLLPASGTPWTKGRMQKFLTNPFYCGWFRYKGGVYEGSHEPYFPRERYDARLERLKSNRNGSLSGRRTHLLSKYLKCSECGKAYIAEAQTGANDSGNYVYYKHVCRGHQTEHRVREEDLLASLAETIEANRFSPAFGESLKDLFADVLKKGQRGHRKEIQTLLAQIEQLDRRKSKLYDLFTIEEIDKFELVTKRREYDGQIQLLRQRWRALDQDHNNVFDRIVEAIDLLHELPLRFLKSNLPGARVELLKTMAGDLSLSPDGNMRVNWAKPYDLLMNQPALQVALQNQSDAGFLKARARGGWEEVVNPGGVAKKIAGQEKRIALGSKVSRRGSRGMSHRVEGHPKDDEFNPVSSCAQERT